MEANKKQVAKNPEYNKLRQQITEYLPKVYPEPGFERSVMGVDCVVSPLLKQCYVAFSFVFVFNI